MHSDCQTPASSNRLSSNPLDYSGGAVNCVRCRGIDTRHDFDSQYARLFISCSSFDRGRTGRGVGIYVAFWVQMGEIFFEMVDSKPGFVGIQMRAATTRQFEDS